MALNNIKFLIQDGGLGVDFPNEDHVSGLVFPAVAAPAGFGGVNGFEFLSLQQLESKGVTATATSATVRLAHFYASQFFNFNSGASLYVIFGTDDPDEIFGITQGRVRRFGFVSTALPTDIPAFYTILKELGDRDAPCVGLIGAFNEDTFADLGTLNNPQVAVVIAGSDNQANQDLAVALATELTATVNCIPAVGSALGILSRDPVNESLSWIAQKRLDGNGQFESVRFSDGDTLEVKTRSDLEQLDNKRYLFPVTYVGISGKFFNDSYTAVAPTSDYSNIENNQVVQKAIRNVRTALLPSLGSPILVDPDTGRLRTSTVKSLEALGDKGLQDLDLNDEISGGRVKVDPTQNVLATSTIEVVIQIVPTGTAREFEVRIGLTPKITI